MTQFLNPRNAPFPQFGLNPGAAANGMVFAGGMALDFETMSRRADAVTIADETRLCLEEIEEIIAAAGCTKRDIVKVTAYLSDDAYRAEFWTAFRAFFEPGPFPARCTFTVGIGCGCRVELDSVSVQPKGS
jgi:2-iminobutanoate/2-iminopropanoate deaminase